MPDPDAVSVDVVVPVLVLVTVSMMVPVLDMAIGGLVESGQSGSTVEETLLSVPVQTMALAPELQKSDDDIPNPSPGRTVAVDVAGNVMCIPGNCDGSTVFDG